MPAATRSIYRPPFRIDVTDRAGLPRLVPAGRLATLIGSALAAGGPPEPAALGLVLADDRELASLNRRHMGHAGPTDVLSFPLLPPSAFPPHPGEPPTRRKASTAPAFALPPGARVHLGDVVVSVDRAIAQAEEGRGGQSGDVRWSPAEELRLLVVHGVLHVCGWDHAEPDEEREMRALEADLLGLAVAGRP